MADQVVYDQYGNVAGLTNTWKPHENHRYDESMGKCGICGKDRYHAEHFNGDGHAAKLAMDAERKRRNDHTDWVAKLAPGSPVMVANDHPTVAMHGMIGTAVEVSRESKTNGNGTKIVVQVKFPDRQVGIASQWLMRPPLPEPPPRFGSQEEADQWLEDTAKEMGIRTEPTVPRFTSPEEADEWMRRQQGEPYVPPSWQADDGGDDPRTWSDQRLMQLLQEAIPPGQPIITTGGALTKATLKRAIQGARMQGIYMDEAIDTSATTADDVIDPYA